MYSLTHSLAKTVFAAIALFGVVGAQAQSPSASAVEPCTKDVHEALTKLPYTGVCEKTFEDGKYECRDFARDYCDAMTKLGWRTWKFGFNMDLQSMHWTTVATCMKAMCGIPLWQCLKPTPAQLRCLGEFRGHAMNIVELPDDGATKGGTHSFAIVEPQERDPNQAVRCRWSQLTPDPVVPDFCRKKVRDEFYSGPREAANKCNAVYFYKIYGCSAPMPGDAVSTPQ